MLLTSAFAHFFREEYYIFHSTKIRMKFLKRHRLDVFRKKCRVEEPLAWSAKFVFFRLLSYYSKRHCNLDLSGWSISVIVDCYVFTVNNYCLCNSSNIQFKSKSSACRTFSCRSYSDWVVGILCRVPLAGLFFTQ